MEEHRDAVTGWWSSGIQAWVSPEAELWQARFISGHLCIPNKLSLLRQIRSDLFIHILVGHRWAEKQICPRVMRAFPGIPMQIRKTILRRPRQSSHVCVCTWWKQRLSVGWREAELQLHIHKKKKRKGKQTPTQPHVILQENPRAQNHFMRMKMTKGILSQIPSPSESSCLMFQWMWAPRKTLKQRTTACEWKQEEEGEEEARPQRHGRASSERRRKWGRFLLLQPVFC